MFHIGFNAIHHFDDFSLELCGSGRSRLEFRIQNHLIVLQSSEVSGLVNLGMTATTWLFQCLELLVREGHGMLRVLLRLWGP